MANKVHPESDQYFPEFWEANRIIGELEASIVKAENIVGQLTSEQIAVKELSAIAANLGTITAGTIKGVSIILPDATSEAEPGAASTIDWELEGIANSVLYGYHSGANDEHININVNKGKKRKEAFLRLGATSPDSAESSLFITSKEGLHKIEAIAGVAESIVTVIESGEKSSFLQLAGAVAKRKIAIGTTEVEWPGATQFSNVKEIEHTLGITPTVIIAVAFGNLSVTVAATAKSATKMTLRAGNWAGAPGAGEKVTIHWIAVG